MSAKVALVTGSSRGIGSAIAKKLAEDGFHVAINYYETGQLDPQLKQSNEKEAAQVLAAIIQNGGHADIWGADVSDSLAVQKMTAAIEKKWGHIDVLVNNAGIINDQLLLRISDEQWDQIIRTNLNSAFYCCRAALRPMVKNRYGRIINITSVVGISGNVGQSHYAASKSGLIGLTRSLAQEYGGRGITANLIAPGYIESAMTAQIPAGTAAKTLERIPLRRMGVPEDVAGVASFLASPAADYITGQIIQVDGGMLMG